MSRKHLLPLSALLLALLGAAGQGWAHVPYCTQSETVILPDGRVAQMHLIHGDGIFGPDPERALLIDGDGRLLARSHRSVPMVIDCGVPGECRIFDLGNGLVLTPDSATFRAGTAFRAGGVISDGRYCLGAALRDVEAGEESWGFRAREASRTEIIEATIALAPWRAPALLTLAVLGAAGTAIAITGLHRPSMRGRWRFALWAATLLLRLIGLGCVAVVCLLIADFEGITALLGFASTGSGVALTASVPLGRRFASSSRLAARREPGKAPL